MDSLSIKPIKPIKSIKMSSKQVKKSKNPVVFEEVIAKEKICVEKKCVVTKDEEKKKMLLRVWMEVPSQDTGCVDKEEGYRMCR